MTGTEIIVIVVGLLIGYWIVSAFGGNSRKPQQQPGQQARPGPEMRRQAQDETGRDEQQWPQQGEPPAAWPEILNVPPDASIDEIRRAYKTLISQYHPDKVAALGPELRELCEAKSKEINAAYDQALAERGAG
jgi:hypothetical protein